MPNGSPWPRISIVTPSYNQGDFIEESIRSVLLQGYPDLQYIIIDGGSSDGSIDILKRYDPWLAYWVSEKDRGQSHALNKGLTRATGGIVGWLNSDDVYLPNTFALVGRELRVGPGILVGDCEWITRDGEFIKFQLKEHKVFDRLELLRGNFFPSSSTFFTNEVARTVGLFDEALHYAMDWDYWIRANRFTHPTLHPAVMSRFRVYEEAKTWNSEGAKVEEFVKLYEKWYRLKDELDMNRPDFRELMYHLLFNLTWLLYQNTGDKTLYKNVFHKYYLKYVLETWKDLSTFKLDLFLRRCISLASYAAYLDLKSKCKATLKALIAVDI